MVTLGIRFGLLLDHLLLHDLSSRRGNSLFCNKAEQADYLKIFTWFSLNPVPRRLNFHHDGCRRSAQANRDPCCFSPLACFSTTRQYHLIGPKGAPPLSGCLGENSHSPVDGSHALT